MASDQALADGSTSADVKVQLVDLPRELVFDIFHHCGPKKSRDRWGKDHTREKLSSVNKYMRAIGIPSVFKHISLNVNEDELERRLQAIQGNESILSAVRFMTLRITCHDVPLHPPWFVTPDCGPCQASAPVLLAQVLRKMSNLEELSIVSHYSKKSLVAPFRNELLDKKITMPSLKALNWNASAPIGFIADVFVNLQVLSLHFVTSPKKTSGIEAIAPRLNLHTLQVTKVGWKKKEVEEICELFPSVPRLLVDGELDYTRVSSLVPVFSKFPKIVDLILTTVPVVHPHPDAMDSALMCEIEELRETHPLNEDYETNALAFFKKCKYLEKLSLKADYGVHIFRPKRQGDEVTGVDHAQGYKVEAEEGYEYGMPIISECW